MTDADPQRPNEVSDWLICPNCHYQLVGLGVRRCPECGHEFDPDDLWHETPKYTGVIIIHPWLRIILPILGGFALFFLPVFILPTGFTVLVWLFLVPLYVFAILAIEKRRS